jgi:hypothetical protein
VISPLNFDSNSLPRQFRKTFNPYGQKYTIKVKLEKNEVDESLFHEPYGIRTVNKSLTNDIIFHALIGKETIGIFKTPFTDYISLDIDFHEIQELWEQEENEKYVLSAYNNIVKKFHYNYPSLVFRSSRGLHVKYFFNYKSNNSVFSYYLEKVLREIKQNYFTIEVLPTENHSLKIDPIFSQLEPKTLKPMGFNLKDYEVYSPDEIFKEDCLPSKEREFRKDKFQRGKRSFKTIQLEKLEEELLPLRNGNSNDTFIRLIPLYFHSGLTIEQATDRFINRIVFQSPGYLGSMRNFRRVKQRVVASYRAFTKNWNKNKHEYLKPKSDNLALFDKELIERITNDIEGNKKREAGVKKFLTRLIEWINFHDSLKGDFLDFESWCFLYREYRANRRRDLYPIPSVLMASWNKRYKEITDYLEEKKVLIMESNYHHDSNFSEISFCRYFRFNRMYSVNQNEVNPLDVLIRSGLSVQVIAERLEVDKSLVSRWINGKREIPKKWVSSIVDKIG